MPRRPRRGSGVYCLVTKEMQPVIQIQGDFLEGGWICGFGGSAGLRLLVFPDSDLLPVITSEFIINRNNWFSFQMVA